MFIYSCLRYSSLPLIHYTTFICITLSSVCYTFVPRFVLIHPHFPSFVSSPHEFTHKYCNLSFVLSFILHVNITINSLSFKSKYYRPSFEFNTRSAPAFLPFTFHVFLHTNVATTSRSFTLSATFWSLIFRPGAACVAPVGIFSSLTFPSPLPGPHVT